MNKIKKRLASISCSLLILGGTSAYAKNFHFLSMNEGIGVITLLDVDSVKPFKRKGFKIVDQWMYNYKPTPSGVSHAKITYNIDCAEQLTTKTYMTFYIGAFTYYDKNDRIIKTGGSNEPTEKNRSGTSRISGGNTENPMYHTLRKVVCKLD